jgi:ethanolamine-phosphate cytidylyltransferase
LIVGIHGDAVVNKRRGMNLPLLNLHERVLSVLGCRFVDDVLIDAPYEITPEMMSSLTIAEVIHGTIRDDTDTTVDDNNNHDEEDDDARRYKHAKDAKRFVVLQSPSDFRLEDIVKRIHRNQETFQARFDRKMKAETQHFEEKYGGAATTNGH